MKQYRYRWLWAAVVSFLLLHVCVGTVFLLSEHRIEFYRNIRSELLALERTLAAGDEEAIWMSLSAGPGTPQWLGAYPERPREHQAHLEGLAHSLAEYRLHLDDLQYARVTGMAEVADGFTNDVGVSKVAVLQELSQAQLSLADEIGRELRARNLRLWAVLLILPVPILLLLFWLYRADRRATALELIAREREAQQRQTDAMMAHLADAVLIMDGDGRILRGSAGTRHVYGYEPDVLEGQWAGAFVHPDDLSLFERSMAELSSAPGAETHIDLRIRHANGSYREVEAISSNLTGDPAVGGVLVHARDVTDRVRAEDALRASEARLRSMLNQVPATVYVLNEQLELTDMVGHGGSVVGLTPDSALRLSRQELLSLVPNIEETMGIHQRALAGEPGSTTTQLGERCFRIWTEPFKSSAGQVVGVLGIVLDVTDAVRSQAEAQRQGDLLHLVTEHAAEFVVLRDMDGAVTYVSPPCQTLLGYTPEEYAAAATIELVHSEDLTHFREAQAVAAKGVPASVDVRLRRKDGSYLWLETMTRPVRDTDGRRIGSVSSSRDIAERKALEARLTQLAYYDHLTGLPNRTAFSEALQMRVEANWQGRVLFMDVDNLKVINDGMGHQAGDVMLRKAAERLRSALPPEYSLFRWGGDEFVALADFCCAPAQAIDLGNRLIASLEPPVPLGVREGQVTLSVGVSRLVDGGAAADPVREANVALHEAKCAGKHRVVLYDPAMDADVMEHMELDVGLRRAIALGEMHLYYQPIHSLSTGQMEGVEVLSRWLHPMRGWIPPDVFIRLAEQSGYIEQLDRWVLEKACRQARSWLDLGVVGEAFTLSVNLSAGLFQRGTVADEIAEVLERTGLPARNLVLEITETVLMRNPTAARATLQRLRQKGIAIAIDDFGTGYSSLVYLREFPVDRLKLDRSFVSGLGQNQVDRAVVAAVTQLAGALGLTVTAEGAELAEEIEALKALGCHRVQGYYFARPMPPHELFGAGEAENGRAAIGFDD